MLYFNKRREELANKRCIDCNKKLSRNRYVRCRTCDMKHRYHIGTANQNNKNNSNYKTGSRVKKHWVCVICGKKLSNNPSTYCKSCWQLGKNNPMYGKSVITKHKIVKHHINKNVYDNTKENLLFLTASKHLKLHHRAYDYLVKIGLIGKYIKWFFINRIGDK
jgi:hypothetical protein